MFDADKATEGFLNTLAKAEADYNDKSVSLREATTRAFVALMAAHRVTATEASKTLTNRLPPMAEASVKSMRSHHVKVLGDAEQRAAMHRAIGDTALMNVATFKTAVETYAKTINVRSLYIAMLAKAKEDKESAKGAKAKAEAVTAEAEADTLADAPPVNPLLAAHTAVAMAFAAFMEAARDVNNADGFDLAHAFSVRVADEINAWNAEGEVEEAPLAIAA